MHTGRIHTLTILFSLVSSFALAQVSTVSMVPSDDLIPQGDLIEVQVFLDEATELAGWQVQLEVTGGDAGSLQLENLLVDDTRSDYAFFGLSSIEADAPLTGELGAGLLSPSWTTVTAPVYLGTFQFRASVDATGVFNIHFVADSNYTFLLVGVGLTSAPILGNDILIGVQVECAIDAHCDDGDMCTDDTCNSGTCLNTTDDTNLCTDGNDCTSDACVSGVCTSTNEPAGTTCNDGLFCTATDACDGSGTCVGSGSPCPAKRPYCCEYLQSCGVLPCI